jgi:hypothetical protein
VQFRKTSAGAHIRLKPDTTIPIRDRMREWLNLLFAKDQKVRRARELVKRFSKKSFS